MGEEEAGKNSQQLSVEDPDEPGALRRVRGRTALALLEGRGQLLDLVPPPEVLRRGEGSFSTPRMHVQMCCKDFTLTLVASKLA